MTLVHRLEQEGETTVLIVDDELDMRIFLSTLFETSGYKAISAKNGSEGIEKASGKDIAGMIIEFIEKTATRPHLTKTRGKG